MKSKDKKNTGFKTKKPFRNLKGSMVLGDDLLSHR